MSTRSTETDNTPRCWHDCPCEGFCPHVPECTVPGHRHRRDEDGRAVQPTDATYPPAECSRCGLTKSAANAGVLCEPPYGSEHRFPPGLHKCEGCGLELDADDHSTRCDDCTPPEGQAR